MLVIIYSKLLILDVRQKDTKSYRPPLVKAACHKQVFLWIADPGTHLPVGQGSKEPARGGVLGVSSATSFFLNSPYSRVSEA